MSSRSPVGLVVLDPSAIGAAVLRAAGEFTGTGLLDTRRTIEGGRPVITEEMFSNAWYDERARKLLDLLTAWRHQGVAFELWEAPEDTYAAHPMPITLAELQNIVEASIG